MLRARRGQIRQLTAGTVRRRPYTACELALKTGLMQPVAMNTKPGFILAGAIYGFTGVALGAFGAHALADALEARAATAIWKTAVQYQMWHALGLLLLALIQEKKRPVTLAGIFFITGTAIFSGSLYGIGLGDPAGSEPSPHWVASLYWPDGFYSPNLRSAKCSNPAVEQPCRKLRGIRSQRPEDRNQESKPEDRRQRVRNQTE